MTTKKKMMMMTSSSDWAEEGRQRKNESPCSLRWIVRTIVDGVATGIATRADEERRRKSCDIRRIGPVAGAGRRS